MDAVLWPFLLYFLLVMFLAAAIIAVSYVVGQRHSGHATGQAYECGIPATGSARLRFPIAYYLVAMFFVVFDVESIFIFAWAIAWRELGWSGYVEVLVFIGIMLAALIYLWRLGALDWGTSKRLAARARSGTNGDDSLREGLPDTPPAPAGGRGGDIR
jgi:NADH-quinone oxidoreductase subunit A